jgi:pyruvate dehydrogenase E2 component (dihydrolipoyllysine-residue acetyltransferase)
MSTIEVRVPGIGGFKDVGVIDVLVKPGDAVQLDSSLVTLESDKATMDVPSPQPGTVRELKVKVGDRVGEGSLILLLEPAQKPVAAAAAAAATLAAPAAPAAAATLAVAAAPASAATPAAAVAASAAPAAAAPATPAVAAAAPSLQPALPLSTLLAPAVSTAHASPAIRKAARELGVDLAKVPGSGPKGRVLLEDVHKYVKLVVTAPAAPASGAGLDLLPWPKVDFARFGPVEARPLSRIKKIAGANLARNWVMIPHVTQHDEADVTELEAFRVRLNEEHAKEGIKVTLLAFLMKACVAALRQFPELNASLDGDALVLKRYFHLGFAADTPSGLVVPVVRDVDQKGVLQVARELGELAAKARDGKLGPAEMTGGCFSISSLGGIGGTAFTPIINAPEVAILGVSRSVTRPVWDGKAFQPRLMLPLSLSYDHRVIDGAAAARFTTFLGGLLADLRRVLL